MIEYLNVRLILKFKYLKACLNHHRTKIDNVTVIICLEQ